MNLILTDPVLRSSSLVLKESFCNFSGPIIHFLFLFSSPFFLKFHLFLVYARGWNFRGKGKGNQIVFFKTKSYIMF